MQPLHRSAQGVSVGVTSHVTGSCGCCGCCGCCGGITRKSPSVRKSQTNHARLLTRTQTRPSSHARLLTHMRRTPVLAMHHAKPACWILLFSAGARTTLRLCTAPFSSSAASWATSRFVPNSLAARRMGEREREKNRLSTFTPPGHFQMVLSFGERVPCGCAEGITTERLAQFE